MTPFRRLARLLVPKPARRYVKDIELRLLNVETVLDVLLERPVYQPGDAIGFNGQQGRKRVFRDLLGAIPFDTIVETGTWVGDTTGYMATTSGLPVWSAEVNPRFHALARARLAAVPGVQLVRGDSRTFLGSLSQSVPPTRTVFFYLDAHWYEDLPLADELAVIARTWPRFVAMVDDFRVNQDPGYGFDRYSGHGELSLDYLAPVLSGHGLQPFFPRLPATAETGARRGCVVVVPGGELERAVAGLDSLRPAVTP